MSIRCAEVKLISWDYLDAVVSDLQIQLYLALLARAEEDLRQLDELEIQDAPLVLVVGLTVALHANPPMFPPTDVLSKL